MRWEDFRMLRTNVEDRRGMGGGGLGIPGGRGGARHRHHHHPGPRRLGARHRPAHPDRRRRDDDRRRQRARSSSSASRAAAGRRAAGRGGPLRRGDPRQHRGRLEAGPARRRSNQQYRPPKLVLFSRGDALAAAARRSPRRWGRSTARSTRRSIIDLSFFQEMQRSFRAGGDFAYAYVHRPRGRPPRREPARHPRRACSSASRRSASARRNQLSVRVELMADCLAGVWAHHSNQRCKSLEEGDIEEAIEGRGGDRRRPPAAARARAASCPIPSRTAPRRSACAGS